MKIQANQMKIEDIPEELKREIINEFQNEQGRKKSERGRQFELIKQSDPLYKQKQSRAGKLGALKRWGSKEIKVVLK